MRVDAPTKTANSRTVGLDQTTLAMIDALEAERRPFGEWMFAIGDGPAAPDRIGYWWSRARAASGIDKAWRLHDLRHFSATQAIAGGHDVRTVAGRLGHANPAMTLRVYAHVVQSAGNAVTDTLSAMLDGSGDYPFTGEVTVQGNRIKQVSKGVVLEYYGQALRETGRPEAAHEVVEQAIQASQRLSPGLLNDRAVVLYSEHRFAEAEAACRRARDESEREGDQSNRAIAIGNLGMVVAELGDNQKALEYHEEARQLAEKHGFEELEANQIGNIGVIYMDLGLYDKSIEYIEDARRRHAAAGRRQAVLICDAELVRARFQAGRITHGQAVQDTHATHTKAADIGYFYVMVPPSHMTGTHPGTDAEIARAAARIEAAERSPSLWTRIRRIFD